MAITISPDDTVDGQMVFAVSRQLLELTGQNVDAVLGDTTVPSDVEGATQEPYEDGDFVGTQVTFEGVALSDLSEGSDPDSLTIVRTGDTYEVVGVRTSRPRMPTCRAIRSRTRSPRPSTPRNCASRSHSLAMARATPRRQTRPVRTRVATRCSTCHPSPEPPAQALGTLPTTPTASNPPPPPSVDTPDGGPDSSA